VKKGNRGCAVDGALSALPFVCRKKGGSDRHVKKEKKKRYCTILPCPHKKELWAGDGFFRRRGSQRATGKGEREADTFSYKGSGHVFPEGEKRIRLGESPSLRRDTLSLEDVRGSSSTPRKRLVLLGTLALYSLSGKRAMIDKRKRAALITSLWERGGGEIQAEKPRR